MVRDPLRPQRDPVWETLLVIDAVNRGLYDLQRRLKEERPISPGETVATWQRLRDLLDRQVVQLAPEAALQSPSERALTGLKGALGAILLSWELSPGQRQRIELWLSQAEREHLGAEAAAA